MKIQPDRVEFLIGQDLHGRVGRLIGERSSNGKWQWTVKSEPVDQRDEGEIARSLSTKQLREIGRIVAEEDFGQ